MGSRSVNSDLVKKSAKLPQEFLLRLVKKRGLEQLNPSYIGRRFRDVSHRKRSGELIDRGARLRYNKGA
jgi:hypothetical protein